MTDAEKVAKMKAVLEAVLIELVTLEPYLSGRWQTIVGGLKTDVKTVLAEVK